MSTTTSTKAPSSSGDSKTRRRHRGPLTNTNTDMLCSDGSILGLWMYRFNLWTGLYMLNRKERVVIHLVGWFSLTVSVLYVYVFWKGFVEGFRESMV